MKQLINLGTGPNSGLGDTLYSGSVKINENFDELYQTIGNAVTLDHIHGGDGISVILSQGSATIVNTKPVNQADWAITDEADPRSILNKPVLFSGSYNDLTDVPLPPSLSAVALSGDYGDLLNAPVFPTLATVATSGDYSDLINTPPRNTLTNGVYTATLNEIGTLVVPDSISFSLPMVNNMIMGPKGNHTLLIRAGDDEVNDPHGGNLRLMAGSSYDNGASGVGGGVRIESGTATSLGGDIVLQAGSGGGGYGSAHSEVHSTGGGITLKAGYGTGRGGSIVISTDSASTYNSFTDEPGILNGDVVIEVNRSAGYVWTYSGNTVRNRNVLTQTSAVNCPVGPPTEVFESWYYSPSPGLHAVSPGIKLYITAEGEVTGDSTGTHTEFAEVMIARRTGGTTVSLLVTNRVHTSTAPLMNITASVDPTLNVVKVFCQPTDANSPIDVILNSSEHYGYMLSGSVIV